MRYFLKEKTIYLRGIDNTYLVFCKFHKNIYLKPDFSPSNCYADDDFSNCQFYANEIMVSPAYRNTKLTFVLEKEYLMVCCFKHRIFIKEMETFLHILFEFIWIPKPMKFNGCPCLYSRFCFLF